MRTRRTLHRSRLLIAVISLACLMVTPARHSAAAEPARLEISRPARIGSQVVADVELYGIFDSDLLATLQSGLPVNLVFRWSIWRERRDWRDEEVSSGELHFRIFFDMLEEDYNIFSARGRPLATCEAVVGVESVVCNREGLVLADAGDFVADASYYVEIEARVAAVGEQEIRGLEAWLLGPDDETNGGPESVATTVLADTEDDDGLTSSLSGLVRNLVRKVAGIEDTTVKGRSPTFHGL